MFFQQSRLKRRLADLEATNKMLLSMMTAKHLTNERLSREVALLRAKLLKSPGTKSPESDEHDLTDQGYPVPTRQY